MGIGLAGHHPRLHEHHPNSGTGRRLSLVHPFRDDNRQKAERQVPRHCQHHWLRIVDCLDDLCFRS